VVRRTHVGHKETVSVAGDEGGGVGRGILKEGEDVLGEWSGADALGIDGRRGMAAAGRGLQGDVERFRGCVGGVRVNGYVRLRFTTVH